MWKAHKTIATSAYGLKLEVFPWSVITIAYVVQESKELIYQGCVSCGGRHMEHSPHESHPPIHNYVDLCHS